MASWWTFWALVLSGFFLSGDFKSIQDGASTKNVETPANTNDWKWKAAAEGGNRSSPLIPQEIPQDQVKKHAKMPPALATASTLLKILQEKTTSFPTETMTKIAFTPKNVLPETKSQAKSKHLPLEMTKSWPWLVEVTSKPTQAPLSTVTSGQDTETAGPVSKRKDGLHSSFKKVTPSSASLDDPSTASPHDLTGNSGFSTATQKHPPKDLKSKIKPPLITATSATPQHLDEILSTPQTLVDDTEFSAATQKHSLGSGRPGLNPRAKPLLTTSEPHKTWKWLDEVVSTSLAFSTRSPRRSLGATTSGSSATTQGKPPLANDTSLLIGKCLLAILLLALVAAIFIVCSGVLAIMLWRQRRAYRLGQANHTEMVCISSLLSAEKEEEEEEEEERRRRRRSKVKRVQLLGDTASETEADNLTLNSFLPDH
ncbi:P-selectin glycoprotein ligand 1 [Notechis scutatus]|uniref:P-selectin glycoprotein ligand 1 n=1 Tax=Notechis scutatus TaxID=8663 RepID=A0A6J1VKV9_9SAUR|nr:P-selectin glycoprotein ligand 1 [Notechis scutatus]